jgi:predicted transglutaminase-like cysteine proteinase
LQTLQKTIFVSICIVNGTSLNRRNGDGHSVHLVTLQIVKLVNNSINTRIKKHFLTFIIIEIIFK